MLLVLDIAPQQVVEWPQRIKFHHSQRVAATATPNILKTATDRIHRLYEHALLHPVRPDKLYQTWAEELLSQDAVAVLELVAQFGMVPVNEDIRLHQGLRQFPLDDGEIRQYMPTLLYHLGGECV